MSCNHTPQTPKPDHPNRVQHQAIALTSIWTKANSYIPNSLQLRSLLIIQWQGISVLETDGLATLH
jgi:hypothetical protein